MSLLIIILIIIIIVQFLAYIGLKNRLKDIVEITDYNTRSFTHMGSYYQLLQRIIIKNIDKKTYNRMMKKFDNFKKTNQGFCSYHNEVAYTMTNYSYSESDMVENIGKEYEQLKYKNDCMKKKYRLN
ncbi:MAG: hypothetical protein FWH20_04955 [Oscillospiraceae bacterium]|nr:hypothetical protein [Oscillospiraceae bacterium]